MLAGEVNNLAAIAAMVKSRLHLLQAADLLPRLLDACIARWLQRAHEELTPPASSLHRLGCLVLNTFRSKLEQLQSF